MSGFFKCFLCVITISFLLATADKLMELDGLPYWGGLALWSVTICQLGIWTHERFRYRKTMFEAVEMLKKL